MKRLGALLFSAVLAFTQTDTSAPMPPDKALQLSREYAGHYLSGDVSYLWPKMTPEMQTALKSEADTSAALGAAFEQVGHESQVQNERIMPVLSTDLMIYTRLAEFDKVPVKLVTTIVIDSSGKIAGMSLRPVKNPAESKYHDYKLKTLLRFPLSGVWTIYQGGRSTYDNYHAAYPDERFAYDIVVIHANGRYADGDGTKPENYYSFGQPVFAPATGKVVAAVDQYEDNAINKPLKDSPKQGNNIVIDHGNGEFSMFAHLKRSSVRVKPGDEVRGGQQIASVGNSGNAPVPHLHYHMQTTPDWFKGDGLPTPFQNITINGKKLQTVEPIRGDIVKAE